MLTIIQKEYVQDPYSMFSGRYEAEIRTYKKYPCKRGVYYVAIQDNPADNVYFFDPNETGPDRFRGFGGSTLEFQLEDGTIDKCKGPWRTNSDSLYGETGIDIRNTCLTFGVIGLSRDRVNFQTVIRDVVYIDDKPTLGNFNRIEDKAQEMANEHDVPLTYLSISKGGSSNYYKFPSSWTKEQKDQFFEDLVNKFNGNKT